jgi:hypothetical protein
LPFLPSSISNLLPAPPCSHFYSFSVSVSVRVLKIVFYKIKRSDSSTFFKIVVKILKEGEFCEQLTSNIWRNSTISCQQTFDLVTKKWIAILDHFGIRYECSLEAHQALVNTVPGLNPYGGTEVGSCTIYNSITASLINL